MGRITELEHPLSWHHLATLRDQRTPPHLFREQVGHLSLLLACKAMETLPLRAMEVETPLARAACRQLACRIALVPILRAGLGMADAIQALVPTAEVWHLGFYRDETTHQPVEYYRKFSSAPPEIAFILDPMLATGGSACEGIGMVRQWGVERISLLCLIAAPEGVARVQAAHPDVDLYTCAIDERLDENAYIVPGLGDAGDRIFNTH